MQRLTIEKLGKESVYDNIKQIPSNYFDIVFSNLVICVVDKVQVKDIMKKLNLALIQNGIAFVGFCNPLKFNIQESQLQKRFVSGLNYEEEHEYKKYNPEEAKKSIEKKTRENFGMKS